MIRMNSETCISFADPEAMTLMGEFIQEERRLNQPTTYAPVDLSPENYDRGIEEQYKRLEQQFRSELLQLVGVDTKKSSEKPSIVQPSAAALTPSKQDQSKKKLAKEDKPIATSPKGE